LLITYHFKIKPNKEQEKLLINTLKYSRYLYNHLLDLRIRHYHNYKKSISKGELENYAKFLATTNEFAFLKEIHSHLVQDVVARLDNSYDRFFKKLAGFPKFKNSKKYNSFTFKQPSKMNLFSSEGFVNISKVGFIRLINHQGLDLKKLNKTTNIKTLNIKKENNSWYCNLTIEVAIEEDYKVDYSNAIGVDLGIKSYLALSNGIFVENPKYLRANEAKLKQLQKQYSRKAKGSNNQEKLRNKINRLHLKIKNQRRDFLHKVSLMLVKTYDVLIFEKLRIENMVKNRKLSKSISDASWGTLLKYVEYKSLKHNKIFEQVDSKNSSQVCLCGQPVPKTLKDRLHVCPICHTIEDRDTHSAKVILSRSKYIKTT
jgi:putative transposase